MTCAVDIGRVGFVINLCPMMHGGGADWALSG